MKIDLASIRQLGITPNQIFLLYSIKEEKEAYHINVISDTRVMVTDKYLAGGKLTPKGEDVLRLAESLGKSKKAVLTSEDETRIIEYRELWPARMLNTGKPARVSLRELKDRFGAFFARWGREEYSWDLIINATCLYLDKKQKVDYDYMVSSGYFIIKQDATKGFTSELANMCQAYEEGAAERELLEMQSSLNLPGQSKNNTYVEPV